MERKTAASPPRARTRVLGAGRKNPDAGKFEQIGKGRLDSRPENPALPRVAAGAAAGGSSSGVSCRAPLTRHNSETMAAHCARRRYAKIPPRNPPIRFRKSVPDCWIGLELVEGKNRQVRRMTAAIGHPTLRLMRVRIGNFWLGDLPPGKWRILTADVSSTHVVQLTPPVQRR